MGERQPLLPVVAHQGPSSPGAAGHHFHGVRDHIDTGHPPLLGRLESPRQGWPDLVRVGDMLGMTAKGLEDFVVAYIRGVGGNALRVPSGSPMRASRFPPTMPEL